MSTICESLCITPIGNGARATIGVVAAAESEMKGIRNQKDKEIAAAKLEVLAAEGYEKMRTTAWCKGLKDVSGLFEIRVNGLRFYCGVVTKVEGIELVAIFGCEEKKGRAPNDKLLQRSENAFRSARKTLREMKR